MTELQISFVLLYILNICKVSQKMKIARVVSIFKKDKQILWTMIAHSGIPLGPTFINFILYIKGIV